MWKTIPEQGEDSHGDELTLHLVWDGRVVLQQAHAQRAAKVVGDGGQPQVVAQVDAGAQQRDQGQPTTQQVVKQQHPRAALGHEELLHQGVVEAALSGVAAVERQEGETGLCAISPVWCEPTPLRTAVLTPPLAWPA